MTQPQWNHGNNLYCNCARELRRTYLTCMPYLFHTGGAETASAGLPTLRFESRIGRHCLDTSFLVSCSGVCRSRVGWPNSCPKSGCRPACGRGLPWWVRHYCDNAVVVLLFLLLDATPEAVRPRVHTHSWSPGGANSPAQDQAADLGTPRNQQNMHQTA